MTEKQDFYTIGAHLAAYSGRSAYVKRSTGLDWLLYRAARSRTTGRIVRWNASFVTGEAALALKRVFATVHADDLALGVQYPGGNLWIKMFGQKYMLASLERGVPGAVRFALAREERCRELAPAEAIMDAWRNGEPLTDDQVMKGLYVMHKIVGAHRGID